MQRLDNCSNTGILQEDVNMHNAKSCDTTIKGYIMHKRIGRVEGYKNEAKRGTFMRSIFTFTMNSLVIFAFTLTLVRSNNLMTNNCTFSLMVPGEEIRLQIQGPVVAGIVNITMDKHQIDMMRISLRVIQLIGRVIMSRSMVTQSHSDELGIPKTSLTTTEASNLGTLAQKYLTAIDEDKVIEDYKTVFDSMPGDENIKSETKEEGNKRKRRDSEMELDSSLSSHELIFRPEKMSKKDVIEYTSQYAKLLEQQLQEDEESHGRMSLSRSNVDDQEGLDHEKISGRDRSDVTFDVIAAQNKRRLEFSFDTPMGEDEDRKNGVYWTPQDIGNINRGAKRPELDEDWITSSHQKIQQLRQESSEIRRLSTEYLDLAKDMSHLRSSTPVKKRVELFERRRHSDSSSSPAPRRSQRLQAKSPIDYKDRLRAKRVRRNDAGIDAASKAIKYRSWYKSYMTLVETLRSLDSTLQLVEKFMISDQDMIHPPEGYQNDNCRANVSLNKDYDSVKSMVWITQRMLNMVSIHSKITKFTGQSDNSWEQVSPIKGLIEEAVHQNMEDVTNGLQSIIASVNFKHSLMEMIIFHDDVPEKIKGLFRVLWCGNHDYFDIRANGQDLAKKNIAGYFWVTPIIRTAYFRRLTTIPYIGQSANYFWEVHFPKDSFYDPTMPLIGSTSDCMTMGYNYYVCSPEAMVTSTDDCLSGIMTNDLEAMLDKCTIRKLLQKTSPKIKTTREGVLIADRSEVGKSSKILGTQFTTENPVILFFDQILTVTYGSTRIELNKNSQNNRKCVTRLTEDEIIKFEEKSKLHVKFTRDIDNVYDLIPTEYKDVLLLVSVIIVSLFLLTIILAGAIIGILKLIRRIRKMREMEDVVDPEENSEMISTRLNRVRNQLNRRRVRTAM